jgi:hypothetical protein
MPWVARTPFGAADEPEASGALASVSGPTGACTAAGFNGKRRIDQRQQRSARNIGARRERSKRGREIALRRDIAPFEARADVAARRLVGTRGG